MINQKWRINAEIGNFSIKHSSVMHERSNYFNIKSFEKMTKLMMND